MHAVRQYQGRNGEFCVTVNPVTKTAIILVQSIKYVMAVYWTGHSANLSRLVTELVKIGLVIMFVGLKWQKASDELLGTVRNSLLL